MVRRQLTDPDLGRLAGVDIGAEPIKAFADWTDRALVSPDVQAERWPLMIRGDQRPRPNRLHASAFGGFVDK